MLKTLSLNVLGTELFEVKYFRVFWGEVGDVVKLPESNLILLKPVFMLC